MADLTEGKETPQQGVESGAETQGNGGTERGIWMACAGILLADQLTKLAVVRQFPDPKAHHEMVVVPGFLNLVHLTNDGAAFSMLKGQNTLLAAISLLAMVGLVYYRRSFDNHHPTAKIALGLLLGGILGNLVDRFARGSVVDFIHVYIERREGGQWSWPAFNVADSAICIGVLLLFIRAWKSPDPGAEPASGA